MVRHLHCDNEIERIHWLLNLEEALGGLNVGGKEGGDGGGKEEGYVPMEWSEGEDGEDDEDEVEKKEGDVTKLEKVVVEEKVKEKVEKQVRMDKY